MDEEPRDLAWEELNGSRRPPKHHIRLMRALIPLFVFTLVIVAVVLSLKSFRPGNPIEKLKSKQGAFTVSETYPRPFDADVDVIAEPMVVFSKPVDIDEKDLSTYLSISPAVTGSWHLEKNGEAAYFASGHTNINGYAQELDFNTVYTLTVKKGIRSVSGDTLTKDTSVRFRTRMDQKATINVDYKFMNAYAGKDIKVPLYGGGDQVQPGDKVHVKVYAADIDQLLTYFTYAKDNWQLLYEYKPKADAKAISSYDVAVENQQYSNRITLPGISQNGLYYVSIGNDYGTDDLFITVTNHINQVISDSSAVRIWTTDTEKGTKKARVKATTYSLEGSVKKVNEGVTDANGLLTIKDNAHFDIVLTEADGSISLSYTNDFMPYISTDDDYKTFIYSDRPVYRPGDTVHVKGIIRKKDKGTFTIPQMDVYMRLADGVYTDPQKIEYTALKVDKNGTFVHDVKLPTSSYGFYPSIIVASKLKDGSYRTLSSMDLNVQSYTKPDIDISATSSSPEYISKDTARITVSAKSMYGQPIRHVPFKYRVLAESYTELRDRTGERIDQYASYYGNGTELTSGSATFDDKGQAVISFSTDISTFEQSAVATIEILPQMGVSPSVGKIATLIHRGEYGIFFDHVKGNVTDGITGDLLTLTHDKERKPAGGHDVDLTLYRYNSYSDKQLVTTQTVSANPEGLMHFSFPGVQLGSYELVAVGKDGRDNTITSRYNVYIGKDTYTSAPASGLNITAETTASTYKPGETATVQITANFPLTDVAVGASVDSAYPASLSAFEIRSINGTSFTYTLQTHPQAANSARVYVYATHDGVVYGDSATINVDLTERVAKSTITFDKSSYKPGDMVTALIQTKDAAGKPLSMDTSLSVMDAAVLRIGKLTDSIDNAFYGDASYISSPTWYNSTSGIYRNRGGGGGGGCFLEGTKILMADGTEKNIEDVREGDTIKTLAGNDNSTLIPDAVTGTVRHIVNEYLTINNTLNVTSVHRIYLNNAWHTAGEARFGDTLLTSEGKSETITQIERHTGVFAVYNLSIKERHTYIANGYYVHNDKGMVPRQNFVDTAYWNPHIQTDANGMAKVSFKLPDNVTTFTASVFGNSADSQFTQTIAELVSKKEFVIIPAIPRFYYEREPSTIAAIVQNTTDKPVELEASVTVKAVGLDTKKTLLINAGDFTELTAPMQTPSATQKMTIGITVKDKSGKTLDSVSLSQPILPKGALAATWESHKESAIYDFKTEYPEIDANTVSFTAAPHYALRLTNKGYSGISSISSYASSSNALSLYVTSYITSRTAEGVIDPAVYDYAATRGALRSAIHTILSKQQKDANGKFTGWDTQYSSYGDDTLSLYNIYMAIVLKAAQTDGVLTGISNSQELVNAATTLATEWYKSGSISNEESVALRWLTGYAGAKDCISSLMTACYASRAMQGDKKALETLVSLALPSADDRLIWDTSSTYASGLAPLAVITYGTDEQADRALVGITASRDANMYTADNSLYLLAAVKHAIRNNLEFTPPKATATINGRTVFDWSTNVSPVYPITTYSTVVSNADMKDGELNIQVKQESGMPIYSTVSSITYGQKSVKKTDGKLLDEPIKRRYRSLDTGLETAAIPVGSSGIIEVSLKNPYLNIADALKTVSYTAMMADMQTPGYMYLNQYAENSPQYQSTLDTYYPGEQYSHSYSQPTWYSDTTVFFNSVAGNTSLVMPYIIYNISAEKPYQPKTAIVFPITGAIAIEK